MLSLKGSFQVREPDAKCEKVANVEGPAKNRKKDPFIHVKNFNLYCGQLTKYMEHRTDCLLVEN